MVLTAPISGTPSLKRTASCMQDDGLAWDNASPMGVSMRPSFNIPYAHYAMIYLDNMGRVKMAESPSIQEQNGTVFTPEIRDRFLEILGAKIGYHRPMIRRMSGVSATPYGYGHPSEMPYHQEKRRRPSPPHTPYDMHASESFSDSVEDLTPYSPADMVGLEIGNTPKILEYYERALKHFQQLNCRQIAKAFIKFIEPRKQVKHPYNGGKPPVGAAPGEKGDPEKTKPEWWPAEVVHKEPDHLRKDQRLNLLIHIIRKLGRFGITPDKLQEVAYDCKRQLKGPERLLILDEIFRVRKMEEQYEKGEIDASTLIYVINRESSPKQDKDGDSLGDAEQKAEGEESIDRDILTPTSSEASTTVSMTTSVDHLSMTAPTRLIQYGDRNPLFPLPESLSFGEPSRESGSFYSTTTEYADDYSSPHVLRTPANSTLVSPHEAPAAFDYLTHAPLPASTAVEQIPRQAALPMHSASFDQWTPSFRQNIFSPMEYGATPSQAIPQPAMNYPHPHSHGLPDLCRERPHMDVMSVRAPACL